MNKSSIQSAPASPMANGTIRVPPSSDGAPSAPTARRKPGPVRKALSAVASLRVTVVLFALGIVLIFTGTLAQMDAGIGAVVKDYFRSLYVWIPLQLFVRFGQVFFGVPPLAHVSGSFPFPGGWLIGGLLLINLLAAHAVRFRLTWKRSGILILHAGILVLMGGELLTGLFAAEGQMTIPEGGSSNIIKHHEKSEIAVLGPLDKARDNTVVVPDGKVRKGGLIQSEKLPFDIQVDEYMPNSRLSDAPLLYAVPPDWHTGDAVLKNGIRRDAVFEVKDGARVAEVSITTALGSVADNVNRWRRQLGLEPWTVDEIDRQAKSLEIAGATATYVDLTGEVGGERQRTLGVVLPRLLQSSFIVMRGPAELVGKQKSVFEAFLGSFRTDAKATAGDGAGLVAEPARQGAGVDSEQTVDFPSAFITLKKKGTGESLGTYLVSDWLSELYDRPDQKVKVDGDEYAISLRFQREYKPYSFQLLAFHHDNYPGTDIPNNFSSEIRVLDPERNVDREVNIHMNVPLRYQRTSDEPWWQLLIRGQETYYQQGFLPGDKGTILQVVRNPGWLAPYFACVTVALGMIVHFTITLYGFLQKRRAAASQFVSAWPRFLSYGLALDGVAAMAVFVIYMLGYYHLAAAGFLAVYAVALLMLHQFSHAKPADDPSSFARYFPWFVVAAAGLVVVVVMLPPPEDPGKARLQQLASLPVQMDGRIKPLDTVARNALMTISDRSTFEDDKKVTHPAIEWLVDVMTERLADHPHRSPAAYPVFRIENDQLLTRLGLERREGLRYSADELRPNIAKVEEDANKARRVAEKDRNIYDNHVLELARKIETYIELSTLAAPRFVPRDDPNPNANWLTMREAAGAFSEGNQDPVTLALFKTLKAYADDQPKEFNESLEEYRGLLAAKLPAQTSKASLETFFNHFAPFMVSMVLFIGVFLLAAGSWIGWSRPLNRAAFWLAVLGLVVHTFGLATRMYLQGRPPVTNLYSSAIFISWMTVLLGLALEVIFEIGIGNALAGVLGFLGALTAHNLATGDTLEMMRAVLDTNFWLATHVVCISIGYSATLLAGFLGIGYLYYMGTDTKKSKDLADMLYGILCFATLFSFVGTVLGGIWADQSWGRFWGWDPKENGAMLIVVMNALTLHARWAGIVKQRGVAMLAIVGNMVTGWSWFGTNQLGVGLHSYGFNNKLAIWLTLFWASQVILIAVALFPASWKRPAAKAPA